MKLEHLLPESVHDFSATVGAWLISEGYGVHRDAQRRPSSCARAARSETPSLRSRKEARVVLRRIDVDERPFINNRHVSRR